MIVPRVRVLVPRQLVISDSWNVVRSAASALLGATRPSMTGAHCWVATRALQQQMLSEGVACGA